MNGEMFQILEIQPEWVLESEGMGSKEKFWYRRSPDETQWLFKFPQPNTGQHWAEKIVAAVALKMDIMHGRVELAQFQGTRGSATESFARDGRSLFHGNQILAGRVLGYDPAKQFRQSDHTFENILTALQRTYAKPETQRKAQHQFAEYMVLDALVGNTDRHHENWGVLRRRTETGWISMLAPTFDHASSLGRELLDDVPGKCRRMFLAEKRIGSYAEKASGAIYWNTADKRGISPLELVRRAAAAKPDLLRPALAKLEKVNRTSFEEIVSKVPGDWMTALAREFAVEFMCYSMARLKEIFP